MSFICKKGELAFIYISMRLLYLTFFIGFALRAPCLSSETNQIFASADGDLYLYTNSYTTNKNYMNVGQYYGGFSTHYYIGLANWNNADLNPLIGKTNVALTLFVQNFVVPIFGPGGPNSQPSGFTNQTTGNFSLKVVALPGIPDPSSITDAWVKTNMINAVGAGYVTLTDSGYNTVNIGSISNWITSGSSSRWLGFVGTNSTTSAYTSIQLGTLEPSRDFDGNILVNPAPMYLSAETSLPTPPPSAPVARSSRIISTNEMEITFDVVPGFSYVLTTKSNLSDTNWATFYPSFVASSNSTNLIVPMTNSLGRGFYRLEVAAP